MFGLTRGEVVMVLFLLVIIAAGGKLKGIADGLYRLGRRGGGGRTDPRHDGQEARNGK